MPVGSPGGEDPLEEGMTAHSSILAWRIPGTEEPGRLSFLASQRLGHDRATNIFTFSQLLSTKVLIQSII